MKKAFSKILSFNIILLCMMLTCSNVVAQLWGIKLVNRGTFEVNITPPDILEEVIINVSFTDANNQVTTADLPFTNDNMRYLKPGNTYAKSFTCDNSVKKVIGNSISYLPSGGGDKADMARGQIRQTSSDDIKSSGVIRLQGESKNSRVRDHRRKREIENITVRDYRRKLASENVEVRDHPGNRQSEDVHVKRSLPNNKTVQIEDTESYDFLQNTKGKYTGGNFYYLSNDAKFYANNSGQRGLLDLGNIGQGSLAEINIPTDSGYNPSVPVLINHTYVALAREEGHFIIFRVNQINSTSVVLSYFYR